MTFTIIVEKYTKVYAEYDQFSSRYSEDTWDNSAEITNADDLFEFMKDCHLLDARNRNNYPITSCWNRWVKFSTEDFVTVNGETYRTGKKVPTAAPNYYDATLERYKTWEKRLKDVLERRKEQTQKIRQENNDRLEYERLSSKYNN